MKTFIKVAIGFIGGLFAGAVLLETIILNVVPSNKEKFQETIDILVNSLRACGYDVKDPETKETNKIKMGFH